MRGVRSRGDSPLTVLEVVGNAIVGGMETAVLRLVQGLPRADFRIHVLCPFRSAFTDALAPHVEAVHVAPMDAQLRWHTVQRAVGIVREAQVDVVHAHLWTAHLMAALAGRLCGVPVLATAHGMHVTMADLEAHLLGGTHLCLVSEAARAHALAAGADPARVHVVRNGIDVASFPRRGVSRAMPLTIGYVARLSTEKNPELFVRAAARVHRECPAVRFVIVGDGPLRGGLAALAHGLGLEHALRFEGIRQDMPDVYATLDVLALTSWHEGTPLALLEAMASGVPVVATSVGGVPELVVVGTSGLLTPPGDDAALAHALLTLVRDAPLRARLGAGARTRVAHEFALSRQLDATAALLRGLARERDLDAEGRTSALVTRARWARALRS